MLQQTGSLSRNDPASGYPTIQPTEVELPARFNGLDPWRVSEFHYPFYADVTAKLAFCLRYAILAPSSHNNQPWYFMIERNEVALYADRTRSLPIVDPDDRELMISCGAALANLCIAIRHFGHEAEVTRCQLPNDADLIAIVRLGREHKPTCEEKILFQSIPIRRTNRRAFEETAVSCSLLRELRTACGEQGVTLTDISDAQRKLAIAGLVGEGDRLQMANPAFRTELAHWIRPAKAETRDGIPCHAQSLPKVLDIAAPFVSRIVRTFDMGDFMAARDTDLANACAVLAVLSTPGDTPADWLAAGVALEHVLLTARAAGVWTSFLNQPIEVPELRSVLGESIRLPGHPADVAADGLWSGMRTDTKARPG